MQRLTFVLALIIAVPAMADAQSLAEVARAEAARRKALDEPARVYTNESLEPDFTRPVAAASSAGGGETAEVPTAGDGLASPGAGAPSPAGPASSAPERDQAYWSARINAARAQLDRSRTLAEAMQSRINALATDFINRDDPAQRAVLERDRLKALAELERLEREIEDEAQAIADIQEEARKAGVPPGWLRP